ncbi:MAG: hypothetical protein QXP36_05090 [Conexivisphaerales archaeon]
MFASKNVKVGVSLYYEARRFYYERLRGKIGFARFCDIIFRVGFECVKKMSGDEILRVVKNGAGEAREICMFSAQ